VSYHIRSHIAEYRPEKSGQRKTPPIRPDAMGFIEFNQRGNYNMSKELQKTNKQIRADVKKYGLSSISKAKGAIDDSILCGLSLIELKKNTPHGQWESEFKSAIDGVFGLRHGQKLMQIADQKELIKLSNNGEILTINEILQLISEATPEQIAQAEQLKKEEADRVALAEANKALAESKAAIDNAKKQDDVIDGVFVEVKKPAPIVEIEPEFDEIEELRDLLDEQHSANKALQDDNDSLLKIHEGNEPLAIAMEELKKSNAMNRILNERINGLMNEKNEAIRNAKMWKGQFERLEKKLKAA